jgi:hypothetical protein
VNPEEKDLEHFGTAKSEIPTVTRCIGVQRFADPGDETSGSYPIAKSRREITTVHLLGRVAEIKGIGKVPKGIRHRNIGDRGIAETKELDIRVHEVLIRNIPIRSGPSDHSTIWTINLSKGEFRVSAF